MKPKVKPAAKGGGVVKGDRVKILRGEVASDRPKSPPESLAGREGEVEHIRGELVTVRLATHEAHQVPVSDVEKLGA